jgi:hypothetical protein
VQCSAVQCSAVQCSPLPPVIASFHLVRRNGAGTIVKQCSAVQRSAVQFSAVQCSAVQCSSAQCSAVQCSAVQCSVGGWHHCISSTLHKGRVAGCHCSAVQCTAVQCSVVQCSAVQQGSKKTATRLLQTKPPCFL